MTTPTITAYDCTYIDKQGERHVWVTLATGPRHVISSFNELVGEGRIVSILPCSQWE